jgi:hypothetical protein
MTLLDIENSFKEQLQLTLTCTRLKITFTFHASFIYSPRKVVAANEDIPSNSHTGMWSNGCFRAPFYGRLDLDNVYFSDITIFRAALSGDSGGGQRLLIDH